MSEALPEIDRFANFGPAMREWAEFVHDYADHPLTARTMAAVMCSLVTESSGHVDLRRVDMAKLAEARSIGRKAVSLFLREAVAEGFMRLEVGPRGRRSYFVREDIARENLDARAGIRRDGLRVLPGGKR